MCQECLFPTWIKSCGTFLRLNDGFAILGITFLSNKNETIRFLGSPLLLHVRLGVGEGAVGPQVADAPAPANLHIRLATLRGVLAAVIPIWVFPIRASEF